MANKESLLAKIAEIAFAVFAIWAIKSLLEDDSGSVISNQGVKLLDDEEKMKEYEELLAKAKSSGPQSQQEILIDLD
jgi:hypothetical protein